MQDQNFNNHSRMVPLYHYVTYLLILSVIIASAFKLYKSYTYSIHWLWLPALFFVIGLALALLAFFTRSFALKAQDRAIRAEENLRFFAMTGNLLDNKLSIQQIVALRFAENNELVELAHRAVKENLKPSDIKKAIKNWKADHHRV